MIVDTQLYMSSDIWLIRKKLNQTLKKVEI